MTKPRKIRIANDYYPTPVNLVKPLLDRVNIRGIVLEPCAGHGAIASQLPNCSTNDPYPTGDFTPDWQLDATLPESWLEFGAIDWVVTNPPYGDMATPIVQNALDNALTGVAMLLRLNWFEPCRDRVEMLTEYADCMTHLIIVSPRPKFRTDTTSSDSITVAWAVWQKAWSWHKKKILSPFQFLTDWKEVSDA